jgi:hypothetical protein
MADSPIQTVEIEIFVIHTQSHTFLKRCQVIAFHQAHSHPQT